MLGLGLKLGLTLGLVPGVVDDAARTIMVNTARPICSTEAGASLAPGAAAPGAEAHAAAVAGGAPADATRPFCCGTTQAGEGRERRGQVDA